MSISIARNADGVAYWTSMVRLAKYLGRPDQAALLRYISSPLFKPYYRYLHAAIMRVRGTMPAGFQAKKAGELITIQRRIEQSEGSDRYSLRNRDNHDDFDFIDHHAYFLVQVVEHNTENNQGLFYRKHLTLAKKQLMVWQLLLKVKLETMSRSRVKVSSISLRLDLREPKEMEQALLATEAEEVRQRQKAANDLMNAERLRDQQA